MVSVHALPARVDATPAKVTTLSLQLPVSATYTRPAEDTQAEVGVAKRDAEAPPSKKPNVPDPDRVVTYAKSVTEVIASAKERRRRVRPLEAMGKGGEEMGWWAAGHTFAPPHAAAGVHRAWCFWCSGAADEVVLHLQ